MQNKKIQKITQAAIIAAMYAALTYAQQFLLPGSASMMIQFRVSEVLNILAFFTPVAIPGLTIGCVIANIYGLFNNMPFDIVLGPIATLGATLCMYWLRHFVFSTYFSVNNGKPESKANKFFNAIAVKDFPLLGMLMPAIWNGVIVGLEIILVVENKVVLSNFTFKEFGVAGGLVALGELGVMFVLGTILYYVMLKRNLDKKLFS